VTEATAPQQQCSDKNEVGEIGRVVSGQLEQFDRPFQIPYEQSWCGKAARVVVDLWQFSPPGDVIGM